MNETNRFTSVWQWNSVEEAIKTREWGTVLFRVNWKKEFKKIIVSYRGLIYFIDNWDWKDRTWSSTTSRETILEWVKWIMTSLGFNEKEVLDKETLTDINFEWINEINFNLNEVREVTDYWYNIRKGEEQKAYNSEWKELFDWFEFISLEEIDEWYIITQKSWSKSLYMKDWLRRLFWCQCFDELVKAPYWYNLLLTSWWSSWRLRIMWYRKDIKTWYYIQLFGKSDILHFFKDTTWKVLAFTNSKKYFDIDSLKETLVNKKELIEVSVKNL